MPRVASLERWFAGVDRALLGYSGGVDSALLAVVGRRTLGPDRFLAATATSASYPDAQWLAARELASRYDLAVVEIGTDELSDPNYKANSTARCYYCKQELWGKLRDLAKARGIGVIVDGTNADDLAEHRPGYRAGEQLGIRSPLVELGWSKAGVREVARGLGLPNWDAPASPCLASRIRYGVEVTADRLRQVERAEAVLRELGVCGDLRVRHHGDIARVEVVPAMFALVDAAWPRIELELLNVGFASVERDPRGYRRGSLLPLAS